MRFYIAEIVLLSMELACAITNHAFGCWTMNRWPCQRLYHWAHDIVNPLPAIETRVESVDRARGVMTVNSEFVSTANSGPLFRLPRRDD